MVLVDGSPGSFAGVGERGTDAVISAFLFGPGHLAATSAMVDLTPLVITRAILANGIAGVAFGSLYWKRG